MSNPFLTGSTASHPLFPPQVAAEPSRKHRIAGPSGGASRTFDDPSSSRGPGPVGNGAPARLTKKRRAGRGRMMMVKVFYSLSSPRFNPAPVVPPPAPRPAPSTYSASFLATLDPSLAPPIPPKPLPSPPIQQEQQAPTYTCLARLSAPVWVQLLGGGNSASPIGRSEYGKLTLKTCLSAICISRPELVTDPTKDYAVSAVDPYESSLQPLVASSNAPFSTSLPPAHPGQGLMEGKGMLSWNLAEKREGTTWVCGKVMQDLSQGRAGKRRKVEEDDEEADYDAEEGEGDTEDEEEGTHETLEVWLQLVERPAFTQTQFLTSLRSFANPATQTNSYFESSDRPSPPSASVPLRRRQTLPSSSFPQPITVAVQPQAGDPVKKKRPRDPMDRRFSRPSLPTPAPTSNLSPAPTPPPIVPEALQPLLNNPALKNLTGPQILALVVQMMPTIGTDSEESRALWPAIKTLLDFYGVALPEGVGMNQGDAGVGGGAGDIRVDAGLDARTTSLPMTTAAPAARRTPAPVTRRKVKLREHFVALPATATARAGKSGAGGAGNGNPVDLLMGCPNCKRKKCSVWREGKGDRGEKVVVCNACGLYYNKHGHHRNQADRTSPVRSINPAPSIDVNPLPPLPSTGRPLQGRLTATCESDLLATKMKRRTTAGLVAPPSPSKHIGPSRSPGTSYNSIFRGGVRAVGGSGVMTSPGRSPRLGSKSRMNPFAFATSPVRSVGMSIGKGLGLRSGYESEDEGRKSTNSFDFATLYGAGYASPSPRRALARNVEGMPEYLLTASPATALKRILNDTNIDLGRFDMPMPGDATAQHGLGVGGAGAQGREEHPVGGEEEFGLSMYLRSSPEEKENAAPALPPLSTSPIAPATNSLSTLIEMDQDPVAPSTDFESVLSGLRRDFSTSLSSNALTAPSSPPPSSPCVQPRTSSATPGQKGKAPASCGRPAPSIRDSFIDSLVPAIALNSKSHTVDDEDEIDELDDEEDDHTPLGDSDAGPSVPPYSLNHLLRSSRTTGRSYLPSPFLTSHATSDQPQTTDYDFGSLPPSSPPALPSEAGPTPSEFGSGITPDGEGYLEESGDDTVTYRGPSERSGGRAAQEAVEQLLMCLGPNQGREKVELDRGTVNRLLRMLSGNEAMDGESHSPRDGKAQGDVFGSQEVRRRDKDEMEEMYESMFSQSGYEEV